MSQSKSTLHYDIDNPWPSLLNNDVDFSWTWSSDRQYDLEKSYIIFFSRPLVICVKRP